MAQYIDKSAIVAEIEKKLDKHSKLQSFNYGAVKDLESLLNFLDTLDVKEVDLEKEIKLYKMRNPIIQHREESLNNYMSNVARHFFELGLKAQKGE